MSHGIKNPIFSRLSIKREKGIFDGIEILQQWIENIIEEGIKVLSQDPFRMEEIAGRMVDAGMSGIARKLRNIVLKNEKSEEWVNLVMYQMGEFLFLIERLKAASELNENQKEDLLHYFGVSLRKEDIKNSNSPIVDEWLYLGKVVEKEDKLTVYRHWFYGRQTAKQALLIDFQIGPFLKDRYLVVGKHYEEACFFYPSESPQRVVDLSSAKVKSKTEVVIEAKTIPNFLDYFAKLTVKNPFLSHTLCLLTRTKLTQEANKWFLVDESNEAIEIKMKEKTIQKIWPYLSSNETIVIGEYMPKQIQVLGVCLQGKMIKI